MSSKKKQSKFDEIHKFGRYIQYLWNHKEEGECKYKGKWNEFFDGPKRPICIEVGCGKAEFSTYFADKYKDKYFLAMDIKDARMWRGFRTTIENKLDNIGFIRTHIEYINDIFTENEVSEIWIPFADPQPSKIRKRLTSPQFLERYSKILTKDATINLKTDSTELYEYTLEVIKEHGHKLIYESPDINTSDYEGDVKQVETFYEKIWLKEGRKIKYVKFKLNY